ncbi:Uncharacterised protein [uncultured archaeon]|nr:Uncharacterised protein [uncultured archaeon]
MKSKVFIALSLLLFCSFSLALQLPAQFSIIKKGSNMAGGIPNTYTNEVLPSLYSDAKKASPGKILAWTTTDEKIFSDSFVIGFHVGYISEQIIIAKGTGKILKPAEAMKNLEQGEQITKGTGKGAIGAAAKLAQKYEGAEKLLRLENGAQALANMDKAASIGEKAFNVSPKIEIVDELPFSAAKSDLTNNTIKIGLKNNSINRQLDLKEIDYLIYHEQSHFEFADKVGDISKVQFNLWQQSDASWFEEFANDSHAYSRLGLNTTDFVNGLGSKLNAEVTSSELANSIASKDYSYLIIQKARAEKYGFTEISNLVDNSIISKSPAFKSKFNYIVSKYLSYSDNLNSSNFYPRLWDIVDESETIRNFG